MFLLRDCFRDFSRPLSFTSIAPPSMTRSMFCWAMDGTSSCASIASNFFEESPTPSFEINRDDTCLLMFYPDAVLSDLEWL